MQMGDQIDQSAAVDEQHRQDCACLNRDVEQFRVLAEPSSAISRCPVLEIGKNSVMPSTMPRTVVCQRSVMRKFRLHPAPAAMLARHSTGYVSEHSFQGACQLGCKKTVSTLLRMTPSGWEI
jgi:hypothetical protein